MCFNKINEVGKRVNANQTVSLFSYVATPWEDAERYLELLAKEVLPEVKNLNGEQADGALRGVEHYRVTEGLGR